MLKSQNKLRVLLMSICINSLSILDFFCGWLCPPRRNDIKFFSCSRDNNAHSSIFISTKKFFFFLFYKLILQNIRRPTAETPCVSPLANCHIDSTIVLLFITFLSFLLLLYIRGSQLHAQNYHVS
jgi:hypothetical protein